MNNSTYISSETLQLESETDPPTERPEVEKSDTEGKIKK